MTKQEAINAEKIREAVNEVLRTTDTQIITSTELRHLVAAQVRRVIERMREDNEESAQLYGAPDLLSANQSLDLAEERLVDAIEEIGNGGVEVETGGSESEEFLLRSLVGALSAVRCVRRHLKPKESTYSPDIPGHSAPTSESDDFDTSDSKEEEVAQ